MKKILTALAAVAILFTGCESDDEIKTQTAGIQLSVDGSALAEEGVTITLSDGTTSIEVVTDANGLAEVTAVSGVYTASASFKVYNDDNTYEIYNGSTTVELSSLTNSTTFKLPLSVASTSTLIIKEIYAGGCTYNTSDHYIKDKYMVLYNNSDQSIDLKDICFGFPYPPNNWASNKYYSNGTMSYFSEGWTPQGWGFWGFRSEADGGLASYELPAYSQVVIAVFGAIDHTVTYANSVDLSGADYAMYDLECGFSNTGYYPAPDESIPSTHYLKGYKFGISNAWACSYGTPGFFIFNMSADDAKALIADTENMDYTNGEKLPSVKIPNELILDGSEQGYTGGLANTKARLYSSIDASYVKHTPFQSHSLYRNVDVEATLAIEGNEDLLVYNYTGGTEDEEYGSTDPSGIDAEASIANGAKIVFQDTNNSENDFHQRAKATLCK
ncbi:MAG: DUF4876 domain-containing protein [Bacteroidales bacterium]|nr:DUF4876 domain-containing protein [Bacteroidales bacterium]